MIGHLRKMVGELDPATNKVEYFLPVGDEKLPLTPLIGKSLKLTHTGNIHCQNCQKFAEKTWAKMSKQLSKTGKTRKTCPN